MIITQQPTLYERLEKIGLAAPYSNVPVLHPHGDKVIGTLTGRGFNPLISESVLYRTVPSLAITSYDDIINNRANGNYFDWWDFLTATLGGVTTTWYSTHHITSSPRGTMASTGYADAGAGGQVYNGATSGGLQIPVATSQRYLTTCGISIPNISGFVYAMLIDILWGGRGWVITSNTTITPTSEPTLTRYYANYPNAYNAAGNMILNVLQSNLTFTVAATITFTYTPQSGIGSQTTSVITPATGKVTEMVIFNNLPGSGTINTASPFTPFASGDSGVQKITKLQIAGGNVTAGTIDTFIVRPLLVLPFIAANTYIERDSTINMDGLIELVKGSDAQHGSLYWLVFTAGATATTFSALLRTVSY